MLKGGYSDKYKKLQLQKSDTLVTSGKEAFKEREAKVKELSKETNRRRRELIEKRKQLDLNEEKRRQKVLAARREQQREATEKFQKYSITKQKKKDEEEDFRNQEKVLRDGVYIIGDHTVEIKDGQRIYHPLIQQSEQARLNTDVGDYATSKYLSNEKFNSTRKHGSTDLGLNTIIDHGENMKVDSYPKNSSTVGQSPGKYQGKSYLQLHVQDILGNSNPNIVKCDKNKPNKLQNKVLDEHQSVTASKGHGNEMALVSSDQDFPSLNGVKSTVDLLPTSYVLHVNEKSKQDVMRRSVSADNITVADSLEFGNAVIEKPQRSALKSSLRRTQTNRPDTSQKLQRRVTFSDSIEFNDGFILSPTGAGHNVLPDEVKSKPQLLQTHHTNEVSSPANFIAENLVTEKNENIVATHVSTTPASLPQFTSVTNSRVETCYSPVQTGRLCYPDTIDLSAVSHGNVAVISPLKMQVRVDPNMSSSDKTSYPPSQPMTSSSAMLGHGNLSVTSSIADSLELKDEADHQIPYTSFQGRGSASSASSGNDGRPRELTKVSPYGLEVLNGNVHQMMAPPTATLSTLEYLQLQSADELVIAQNMDRPSASIVQNQNPHKLPKYQLYSPALENPPICAIVSTQESTNSNITRVTTLVNTGTDRHGMENLVPLDQDTGTVLQEQAPCVQNHATKSLRGFESSSQNVPRFTVPSFVSPISTDVQVTSHYVSQNATVNSLIDFVRTESQPSSPLTSKHESYQTHGYAHVSAREYLNNKNATSAPAHSETLAKLTPALTNSHAYSLSKINVEQQLPTKDLSVQDSRYRLSEGNNHGSEGSVVKSRVISNNPTKQNLAKSTSRDSEILDSSDSSEDDEILTRIRSSMAQLNFDNVRSAAASSDTRRESKVQTMQRPANVPRDHDSPESFSRSVSAVSVTNVSEQEGHRMQQAGSSIPVRIHSGGRRFTPGKNFRGHVRHASAGQVPVTYAPHPPRVPKDRQGSASTHISSITNISNFAYTQGQGANTYHLSDKDGNVHRENGYPLSAELRNFRADSSRPMTISPMKTQETEVFHRRKAGHFDESSGPCGQQKDNSFFIPLNKTPTDEDINVLWENVRNCLQSNDQEVAYSDSAYTKTSPRKHYHAPGSTATRAVNSASRRKPPSGSHRGQNNSFVNAHTKTLPFRRYGSQENLRRQNSLDNLVSGSTLQQNRLTQRARSGKQTLDGSSHSSGTATHPSYSARGPLISSTRTSEVSDSLASFMAAEAMCKQDYLSPNQTQAVFQASHLMHNTIASENQQHFRRQGPSALSIEERKVMESLERLNARLQDQENLTAHLLSLAHKNTPVSTGQHGIMYPNAAENHRPIIMRSRGHPQSAVTRRPFAAPHSRKANSAK